MTYTEFASTRMLAIPLSNERKRFLLYCSHGSRGEHPRGRSRELPRGRKVPAGERGEGMQREEEDDREEIGRRRKSRG